MMGELQTINDSTLKMYAATAMAQSLSFSMERKYLEGIGNSDLNPLFQILSSNSIKILTTQPSDNSLKGKVDTLK